jgi:hypothetical protein
VGIFIVYGGLQQGFIRRCTYTGVVDNQRRFLLGSHVADIGAFNFQSTEFNMFQARKMAMRHQDGISDYFYRYAVVKQKY